MWSSSVRSQNGVEDNNYKCRYGDKTRNDIRRVELLSRRVDFLKLIIEPKEYRRINYRVPGISLLRNVSCQPLAGRCAQTGKLRGSYIIYTR